MRCARSVGFAARGMERGGKRRPRRDRARIAVDARAQCVDSALRASRFEAYAAQLEPKPRVARGAVQGEREDLLCVVEAMVFAPQSREERDGVQGVRIAERGALAPMRGVFAMSALQRCTR